MSIVQWGELNSREYFMPVVNLGSADAQKWQIEFYFRIYRSALALQEELADQSFQDWERKLEEVEQQFGEARRADYCESHDEEYTTQEYFKTIIMNSFFVGAYALYEHHRRRIVRRYSLDESSLKGSCLEKSPEWNEIKHYYKVIRNKIVHEGGRIPDCAKATNYAGKKSIASNFLASGRYALTRKFCDEALNNFEQVLLNAVTEFAK